LFVNKYEKGIIKDMKNMRLAILSLFILVIMAFLHILAIKFYLYWNFWWFDLVVHFLGGVAVGTFAYYLISKSFCGHVRSRILVLVIALAVTLVWEIFEFKTGITFVSSNYAMDTVSDILSGLLGASMFLFFISEAREGNLD